MRRRRAGWVIPTAVCAGIALVLPVTPARATTPQRPDVRVSARRDATVTLPTGEHVNLSGTPGRERVLVDHAGVTGAGRALVTYRLQSHTYVAPAVAEPYLGRFLDPDLFDVTRLNATSTANGRLPVRISYRGSVPSAPGVHITSASGGTAHGYLTASSSASFGRALADQWVADSAAGWPRRTTLFTGVTRISADVSTPVRVSPHFPMHTLTIKTIAPDGKPQAEGFIVLLNVDDGRKYGGFVYAEDGEARVSVPAGHYSAISDDFVYNKAKDTAALKITTVNEYLVTGAGQTMTIDHRSATVRATVATPRPATELDRSLQWDRVDAAETSDFGGGYFLDPAIDVAVAPAPKPRYGSVSLTQSWTLVQAKATVPTYSYYLGTLQDHIPPVMRYSYSAQQLATVNAAYYGDGTKPEAAFTRVPYYEGGGLGAYEPVRRATRRTEYVGATGSPVWGDSALINNDSFEDPGYVDGPLRPIPRGTTSSATWFRGPLAPAIPVQPSDAYCFGCRYGNTIGIGLVPWIDSDPTHLGDIYGAEDGLPVARFRFYRNNKLVSDQDDSLGGDFDVSKKKATYKAVLDVDRRLTGAALSTRSQTQLTFSSAKNKGRKLSDDWYCDGDNCRVLPIVQARAALPTDLNGRLPVGRSTITVSVSRVQQASASAAASAKFEYRPEGYGWTTVSLKAVGGGRYSGVITNDRDTAGTYVDVRISGSDKAGSTYRQTVLHAYAVAALR